MALECESFSKLEELFDKEFVFELVCMLVVDEDMGIEVSEYVCI